MALEAAALTFAYIGIGLGFVCVLEEEAGWHPGLAIASGIVWPIALVVVLLWCFIIRPVLRFALDV